MSEHTEPVRPGRVEPNGQTDKGQDPDEPAHMGNKDDGPKDDDE